MQDIRKISKFKCGEFIWQLGLKLQICVMCAMILSHMAITIASLIKGSVTICASKWLFTSMYKIVPANFWRRTSDSPTYRTSIFLWTNFDWFIVLQQMRKDNNVHLYTKREHFFLKSKSSLLFLLIIIVSFPWSCFEMKPIMKFPDMLITVELLIEFGWAIGTIVWFLSSMNY